MEFQRRKARYPLSKPVKEGEKYDVKITDTSRRGDGIAKIEGFIIFVPGTKPGDQVKIQISSVRPRFATANVIE